MLAESARPVIASAIRPRRRFDRRLPVPRGQAGSRPHDEVWSTHFLVPVLRKRTVVGLPVRNRTGLSVSPGLVPADGRDRSFGSPTGSKEVVRMGSRLYVGNLPFSADEQAVRDLFAQDGRDVAEVKLITWWWWWWWFRPLLNPALEDLKAPPSGALFFCSASVSSRVRRAHAPGLAARRRLPGAVPRHARNAERLPRAFLRRAARRQD